MYFRRRRRRKRNGDPKRISKLSIGSVHPREQRKPLSPGLRAGEINYYPGKISHLLLHAKEEGNVTRAKRLPQTFPFNRRYDCKSHD